MMNVIYIMISPKKINYPSIGNKIINHTPITPAQVFKLFIPSFRILRWTEIFQQVWIQTSQSHNLGNLLEIAEEYDTDVQTCIEDLQALSKQLIEKEVVYVEWINLTTIL